MESEFLKRIDYRLGVNLCEYERWRKLLDAFILSRPRQDHSPGAHTSRAIVYSAQPLPPILDPISTISPLTDVERRSSPRGYLPPDIPSYEPSTSRKRTAVDAFANEMFSAPLESAQPSEASLASTFDHTLVPTYTVQSSDPMAPRMVEQAVLCDDIYVRSSSPNRQIAALPSSGHVGRRSSPGQIRDVAADAGLRRPVTPQARLLEWKHQELFARAARAQVQAIPPEVRQYVSLSQGCC